MLAFHDPLQGETNRGESEDTVFVPFRAMICLALCAFGPIAGEASGEVNLGGGVDVRAGITTKSAVGFGGPVHVYGTVTDAAVSIGGDVVVEEGGRVLGDAVSIGGRVRVKDNASVEKNAVAVGGVVDIAPTGVVRGEIVRGGPQFMNVCGTSFPDLIGRIPKYIVLGPFFGFLGSPGTAIFLIFFVLKTLFWLACAVIIHVLFSEQTDRMAVTLRSRFAASLFYGMMVLFLIPFFLLFLLISLVGIPFVPLAIGFVLIMYLFGSTGVALWAGKLYPDASGRPGTLNVVLGVLTISLVRLIPGIGFIVWIVLACVSFGITALTRFGAGRPVPAA